MQAVAACVVVVVAGLGLAQAECNLDKSVKPEDRPGKEELLRTLDPIMGQRADEANDKSGNSYQFVVCGDLPGKTNVSLTQTLANNKNTVALGYNNLTLVTSDRHWLMLTFLGNEKYGNDSTCTGIRQGHVLFICDHKESKINMKVLDDSKETLKCSPTLVVRHRSVCSLSQGGLSGGAVFLIILLVTFGAYFSFGFFYLRLVKGAKGVEQIPHRRFWFRIGNLLADACEAICRCDRYCGSGERPPSSYSGYSPIDEQLAQDLQGTDRDTALLSP